MKHSLQTEYSPNLSLKNYKYLLKKNRQGVKRAIIDITRFLIYQLLFRTKTLKKINKVFVIVDFFNSYYCNLSSERKLD